MLKIHTTIRQLLRHPAVWFTVYPILIYWLLFYAFPAALDGGVEQGAVVFTLVLLAAIVFVLKLVLIPVTLLATLEGKLIDFIRNSKNYTPLSFRLKKISFR